MSDSSESSPAVSVIIATRDRHHAVARLLTCLDSQIADVPFEIIIVDDGSADPFVAPPLSKPIRVLRTNGVERSGARNFGSTHAKGSQLLFVDDDVTFAPDFVALHRRALERWPDALLVGRIRLPETMLSTPFGRFRQQLEDSGVPAATGIVLSRTFCTAANLSIAARHFQVRGGFDPQIISGEDQDLALRHTMEGFAIAYVAEAVAIHHDSAADFRSFCRRVEWGSEKLLPFCRQHPTLPENVDRQRINGPLRNGQPLKKLLKDALMLPPLRAAFLTVILLLERVAPESRTLVLLYRLVLGLYIRRGFKRGWRRIGTANASVRFANA